MRNIYSLNFNPKKTNNMKTKIISSILVATLLVSTAFGGDGWGEKQTSQTIGGGILGGTIGGVIGHQSGKQKEGILIGSILGMVIGNQGGKHKDRQSQHAYEDQIRRDGAHRERLRQAEQQRVLEAQRKKQVANHYHTCNTRNVSSSSYRTHDVNLDNELTEARHRAEQREQELRLELEKQRIAAERRRALVEFRAREQRAEQELNKIRGISSSTSTY